MSALAHPDDDTVSVTRVRPLSAARQAKGRDEVRAIMRAAYRLIGSSDSGSTSVQDILTVAGLSTRAFYRHFPSKDELILAMCRAENERVLGGLSDAIAAAGSPRLALATWIDQLLAVGYDPRRRARSTVLSSPEARNTRGFRQVQQDGMVSMRQLLVEILRAGRRDGSFPNTEPAEDARALLAIVSGLLEARLYNEPGPTQADAHDHTLNMFLRAVGAA